MNNMNRSDLLGGTGLEHARPGRDGRGTDRAAPDFPQLYDASPPTSNSNSAGSSPGDRYGLDPTIPTRKRSIGSSHLGIDPSTWDVARSRRPTPSPVHGVSGSGFGGFGGFESQVIDLTG
jgi:hypothetical protein